MFHENLLEQILDLPDAPLLMQEVNNKLNDERQRREKFYNDIDESMKVEFINGEIVVHSPVMKRHNQATGLLYKILHTYCYKNNLGFVGFEKIMTVFTRNDYEPDIVFFGNEKAKDFKEVQTLFPVPDFVVEILSKSTQKNDRGIKFDDYETHKVAEYWIIDPENEVVEQYLLQEKRYELALKSRNGTIKSQVIKGFEIPIRAIFDEMINFETMQNLLK
jgi:Uma2 family endonuclease